jgi:polysaccharide transporter, PST family
MIQKLKERLAGGSVLSKVLGNSAWLIADRVSRMVMGLFLGAWIARHLGPSQVGEMAYVMAMVGFLTPLAGLGLDALCVKRLVDHPDQARVTAATVFGMRLVAGLFTWAMLVGASWLLIEDAKLVLMLGIFGATLVISATDTVDLWYQSQLKSRLTVASKSIAFLLIAALRAAMVLLDADVVSFVTAAMLEVLLGAVFLLVSLRKDATMRLNPRQADRGVAVEMLQAGWPILASGIMIAVYMKVDQLLIGSMLPKAELGNYSVAMRLLDVWNIVPLALVPSFAPVIAALRKQDHQAYERRLVQLFRLMFGVGLASATITALAAPWLVQWLFGEQYLDAVSVVQLAACSMPWMFLGVALGPWIVNEGLMRFSMVRAAVGAIVSLGLNFLLLPIWGIQGAAVSLVVAQLVSNVLVLALIPATRRALRLQLQACLFITFKSP